MLNFLVGKSETFSLLISWLITSCNVYLKNNTALNFYKSNHLIQPFRGLEEWVSFFLPCRTTLSSIISFFPIPWPTAGILDEDSPFLFKISIFSGPEIMWKWKHKTQCDVWAPWKRKYFNIIIFRCRLMTRMWTGVVYKHFT